MKNIRYISCYNTKYIIFENGFLKENLTEVIATPKPLGDALFAELKKEEIKSKGDEIIEVNKDHLKVKNSKGEITIYKRK